MTTIGCCHLQILLFDFVDFRKISLCSFCENQSYGKLRDENHNRRKKRIVKEPCLIDIGSNPLLIVRAEDELIETKQRCGTFLFEEKRREINHKTGQSR